MKRLLHSAIGVCTRLATFGRRRRLSRDIEDEVAFHLAMREADHGRAGLIDPGRAARRQFGNVTIQERVHDMWKFPSLESFWQDVRYAIRTLVRAPGFAIVAVLLLAIGIGGNTAVYSLVDAVWVRGLPFPESDRLMVLIGNVERATGVERRGGSYPDFLDWRDQAKPFEAMAAYTSMAATFRAGQEPERISLEAVSAPYFAILGQVPSAGRTFRPDEDQAAGRNPVIVLSDGLWKRRFGADPDIVNQKVRLGTQPFDVVGVMPAGFRGLSDTAEAWVPFVMGVGGLTSRSSRGFNVIARLKPGASREEAQAAMDAISENLARAYPDTNDKRAVEISPLSIETFGEIQPTLTTLMIAVTFVLLIACTNVANLLISRSEARQREIAVRAALGAGQGRLVRQLITESVVLALLGAGAGLALTPLAIRGLLAVSPMTLPSFVAPSIDVTVLLFTIACAAGCGLLLGLAPVLHTRMSRLSDALKDSARGTSSARSQRTRGALVVTEVALAVVLLVGAGLMIRSVQKLSALDPGFDPSSVLSLNVSIPRLPAVTVPAPAPTAGAARPAGGQPAAPPPPPPLVVSSRALLERVSSVPGVVAVSLATDVPLGGNDSAVFYAAEGDTTSDAKTVPRAYVHRVSPGFFGTMRIALKSGRDFTDAESTPDSTSVVVSENVARRFWPGQDPIGKRIKQGAAASANPWLTIVGVVAETKSRGLPENPTADPDLYFPFFDRTSQALVIRTSVPPATVTGSVRAAIRAMHSDIVVFNASTMADLVSAQTAPTTFTTWLLTIFAGISLVLSVVGIYGVMSYVVAQRGREFGIRLALGASRGEIVGLVLRNGARLIAIGAVVGVAASFAMTRVLSTLLFHVTSVDPASAIAVGVITVVAVAACAIPAIRATRVDPVSALRID